MAKKRTASSPDTPVYHLTTSSLIALTAPQRSQREIATPDGDSGSYQFPSHQLELPVVLAQDSIARYRISGPRTDSRKLSFEYPPIFGTERFLQEVIPQYVKYTNSASANLWTTT